MSTHYKIDAVISVTIFLVFLGVFSFASIANALTVSRLDTAAVSSFLHRNSPPIAPDPRSCARP